MISFHVLLVCQSNFVLDPATNQCLLSCDAGSYKSRETIAFGDEHSAEPLSGKERLVCRSCPPLCQTCSQVHPHPCTECFSGSKLRESDSVCVPESDQESNSKSSFFFIGVILSVFSSFVLAFSLILFCARRRCKSKTIILPYVNYQHIPKADVHILTSSFSDEDSDPLIENMNGLYTDDIVKS